MEKMTPEQKKKHVEELWAKAKRFTSRIRFQARLQRMAESNLKEMMVEDIADDGFEDHNQSDAVGTNTIPVYMLNSYGTFCNVFNFLITLLLIYDHFAVPVILVFPGVYQTKDEDGKWYTEADNDTQKNLRNIETFIDVFMLIDIVANFFKWTRATKTLAAIAEAYIKSGYFFFDVIATLPGLCNGENYNLYGLKAFRLIHFFRITKPLELLLDIVLSKFSKKRQNDLTSFCCLILYVIYISHILACVWL